MIKGIVKVGEKSLVKLRNCKLYRAITAEEIEIISNRDSDIHLLIIEKVRPEERETVKEIIEKFRNENNTVVFFNDDDYVTSGLADETSSDICGSLLELQKYLYEKTGENVYTFLDEIKNLSKNSSEQEIDDDMPDFFGENTEKELKTDESDFNIADEILEESTNEDETDIDDLDNIDFSEDELDSEENVETDLEEIDTSEEQLDSEEFRKLKIQINDSKEEYNKVLSDMKEVIGKNEKLEKVIEALTHERDDIIKRFNRIVESSSVLEDPISLDEYLKIKLDNDELNSRLVELNSSIKNLKDKISERDTEIDSQETTIKELKTSVTELKKQISAKDAEIENSSSVNEELISSQGTIDRLKDKIESLNSNIEGLKEESNRLRGMYESTLDISNREAESRVETQVVLNKAFNKIIEHNRNSNKELNEIKEQLEDKNRELEKALNKNKDNKEEIQRLLGDMEGLRKSSLVQTNQADRIKKLENENSRLESEIDKKDKEMLELNKKMASSSSGVDSEELKILRENNEALEDKARKFKQEYEKLKQRSQSAILNEDKLLEQNKIYKEQISKLQANIKNLDVAGTDITASNIKMKSISYNGKAKLISVFGSGSFGVTTTAFSIAACLMSSSKVLYIDLDVNNPMGDAWIHTSPFIEIKDKYSGKSFRDSALDIGFSNGCDVLADNINKVIKRNEKSPKLGKVDFISGAYLIHDDLQLLRFDYSKLLNTVGDMYDYIIVDLGKFGNNMANARIIKGITDVSEINVLVTKLEFFEIRNTKVKLDRFEIDTDRISWMLNLTNSTAVDEKIKERLGHAKYGIVEKDADLNNFELFMRRNKTKERFLDFLHKKVLS